MASLEDFARQMLGYAKQVPEKAHAIVRRAALACERKLVLQTPVDTGRARSNWIVGINAPIRAQEQPASAGAVIAAASTRIAASKPGDTIYLSNNLPYIRRLNRGHSRKAPPGYVDQIVRETQEQVKVQARILD